MAEFLTTQGVSRQIENVIMSAKSKVVLISPYLKLSKTLSERLKDADKRSVTITLVYGKEEELRPEDQSSLQQLKNLTVYFFENLHAKCYFNEECMIITSMNLYDFSEKTNREMGVLIRRQEDERIFTEAEEEVKSIINSAEKKVTLSEDLLNRPRKAAKSIPSPNILVGVGYCIRCRRAPISWDPEHPLCGDCYEEWAEWQNPDYKEKFCHTCGKSWSTTKIRPLCDSCFRMLQMGEL